MQITYGKHSVPTATSVSFFETREDYVINGGIFEKSDFNPNQFEFFFLPGWAESPILSNGNIQGCITAVSYFGPSYYNSYRGQSTNHYNTNKVVNDINDSSVFYILTDHPTTFCHHGNVLRKVKKEPSGYVIIGENALDNTFATTYARYGNASIFYQDDLYLYLTIQKGYTSPVMEINSSGAQRAAFNVAYNPGHIIKVNKESMSITILCANLPVRDGNITYLGKSNTAMYFHVTCTHGNRDALSNGTGTWDVINIIMKCPHTHNGVAFASAYDASPNVQLTRFKSIDSTGYVAEKMISSIPITITKNNIMEIYTLGYKAIGAATTWDGDDTITVIKKTTVNLLDDTVTTVSFELNLNGISTTTVFPSDNLFDGFQTISTMFCLDETNKRFVIVNHAKSYLSPGTRVKRHGIMVIEFDNDLNTFKLLSFTEFKGDQNYCFGVMPLKKSNYSCLLCMMIDGIAVYTLNEEKTTYTEVGKAGSYSTQVGRMDAAGRYLGRDMLGRIITYDVYTKKTFIISELSPFIYEADFEEESYNYESQNIQSNVLCNIKNIAGQRLEGSITLSLVGNVYFTDNSNSLITVTTSSLEDKKVPITIIGSGPVEVKVVEMGA